MNTLNKWKSKIKQVNIKGFFIRLISFLKLIKMKYIINVFNQYYIGKIII